MAELDNSEDFCNGNIAKYYEEKSIFITGGTGFIGKVIVEKLLRSCPRLKAIYFLVRPKKGKSCDERMEKIFSLPVSKTNKYCFFQYFSMYMILQTGSLFFWEIFYTNEPNDSFSFIPYAIIIVDLHEVNVDIVKGIVKFVGGFMASPLIFKPTNT